MIIQLGQHQFDTELGYETLERMSAWRWAEVPIIEDYPILQFAHKEAPTITFSGQYFNYVATGDRVESLEDLGNETEPLPLTGDDGVFYGFWVVTSLRRRESIFRPGQQSAIQNAWTLSLTYYGETKTRGI